MADSAFKEVSDADSLKGTTLRVYRLMLRSKAPLGIHDVQRSLGLSSPSVAQYHVRKLVNLKLAREEGDGYVVDRVVVDNVIRLRRTNIPTQTAFVAFFVMSLFVMLTFFRPPVLSAGYLFALFVVVVGIVITSYETVRTFGRV
ncbi:MAG: hypothetical protein JRN34_01530 [Nitrososphaerota archaeon]|nr:hypothetical protein [Nitrososphaerota archaeon]MDG6941589.1 hypothetical protein [Nitrososphaerota archaeon]